MKRVIVFVLALVLVAAGNVKALCVKAEEANLRVGPGTDYAVAWTVFKYFPFKKVGTSLSGRWYAVEDMDGDVFWVHKSLVTTRYRCAAVTSDGTNVRTGPGKGYDTRFSESAKKYYSFKVLGRKGEWVKVRDAGNTTGWVHRDYLRIY